MAALWITQPLTRQARNLSCCFKLVTGAKGQLTQLTQDSLPATRFFVAFRAISTCNVLMQRRRKRFNRNPAGVPQWANYDGNQKCIDGGGFSVLFVADLVCWPFTLPESSVFLFGYPLPYLKDIMQEAHQKQNPYLLQVPVKTDWFGKATRETTKVGFHLRWACKSNLKGHCHRFLRMSFAKGYVWALNF